MKADTAAWEEMYRSYRDKVSRYISGKVPNAHDAEDLVSNVFLKAYKKWDSFDANRASPSTWIYAITRNTVIDYYRTQRVTGVLPEELACAERVDERLLREESLDRLADALEGLSRREGRDTAALLQRGYAAADCREAPAILCHSKAHPCKGAAAATALSGAIGRWAAGLPVADGCAAARMTDECTLLPQKA